MPMPVQPVGMPVAIQPAANNSDRYEPEIPLKEWAEDDMENDVEPPMAETIGKAVFD
jgi:hypothetical protein